MMQNDQLNSLTHDPQNGGFFWDCFSGMVWMKNYHMVGICMYMLVFLGWLG